MHLSSLFDYCRLVNEIRMERTSDVKNHDVRSVSSPQSTTALHM
jgi:hypothetical protein